MLLNQLEDCPDTEANSIPLLRTTTEVQNPSELAADVSFRDDDIKWGRIEGSWWGTHQDAQKPYCLSKTRSKPRAGQTIQLIGLGQRLEPSCYAVDHHLGTILARGNPNDKLI